MGSFGLCGEHSCFRDCDGDGHHHHSGTWKQITAGVHGASGVLMGFEDLVVVSCKIQLVLAALGTEVDCVRSFPNYWTTHEVLLPQRRVYPPVSSITSSFQSVALFPLGASGRGEPREW